MNRVICLGLVCGIFLMPLQAACEDNSILEKSISIDAKVPQSISVMNENQIRKINKEEKADKNSSFNAERPQSITAINENQVQTDNENKCNEKDVKKVSIPNELEERIAKEVEEYQQDFEEESVPLSKWEAAKNLAKFAVQSFVSDLKSYVIFYPITLAARTIAFGLWFIPLLALYKKTGIDVPLKFQEFAMANKKLGIIAQNLYNVIPMTIASFMCMYVQEGFAWLKSKV